MVEEVGLEEVVVVVGVSSLSCSLPAGICQMRASPISMAAMEEEEEEAEEVAALLHTLIILTLWRLTSPRRAFSSTRVSTSTTPHRAHAA